MGSRERFWILWKVIWTGLTSVFTLLSARSLLSVRVHS